MMNNFLRYISLAMVAAILVAMPAEAQKKQKDSRAQAAFEAGEYFEAIDLYKNAYNKVRIRTENSYSFQDRRMLQDSG